MSNTPNVSRNVGFLEKYYICRDTTGVMNRGFNISVKLNDHVSDLVLSHALRRVILSCPYLTVNAFRDSDNNNEKLEITVPNCEPREIVAEDAKFDGKNYHLRPVSKILYSDVVVQNTIQKLDDTLLENLSKIRIPVDREKPMWYLGNTLEESTGDQYLTFVCNHVTFDGRSAVNFFEDLLNAIDAVSLESLTEIENVLFDSVVEGPSELPSLSEYMTSLYDSPAGFTVSTISSRLIIPKFVLKFFGSYFSLETPNFYQYPPFQVVPFNGVNESKFRLVHFNLEEVRTILANCKQQKSTLTPIMASAMYGAIDTAFTPHVGAFSQSCELMICGRRYFPEKDQDTRYGLFVSAFTSYILPGSTLKEAAQSLGEGLSRAMESRTTFYKTGLLKLLNVWDYLRSFTTDGEERNTFEISNLGRVNFTAGKWRVTNVVFSQGVTFAHITLSVISTPEGGMNIVISFHEKMAEISQKNVLAIDHCIEEFKKNLLNADD